MNRKLLTALALGSCLVAVPLTQAQAAAAEQSTAPVTLISDGSTVGSATLTRTSTGIAFAVQTTALRAGDAVTIWVMAQNPDGGTAVLYGAGQCDRHVGDSSGYAMGDDTTLEDARNATVTLVVRDHGAAQPATVEQQIHTIDACNPTCTDQQVSVHQAG
jgi:hypothetical protein